jgi:hypothetical protein
VAGTVANERQLTGIINLDDRFQAASSEDRLSSPDPMLTYVGRISQPESSRRGTT